MDSGAQASIMNEKSARLCNLMHIVDKSIQGVALGVGSCKIIGKIHHTEIVIGNLPFPAGFTGISCFPTIVLESNEKENSVDFIFGLDLLRKLRCCIDLNRQVLRVGTEPYVEVKFIPDPNFKQ